MIHNFGEPDLTLAYLDIWVHNRFESHPYKEGSPENLLNITAHCGAPYADVWADGPLLNLPELERWLNQLKNLSQSVVSEARLKPLYTRLLGIQSHLWVVFKRLEDKGYHVEICITPDRKNQRHEFYATLDRQELLNWIEQLQYFLTDYPVQ